MWLFVWLLFDGVFNKEKDTVVSSVVGLIVFYFLWYGTGLGAG